MSILVLLVELSIFALILYFLKRRKPVELFSPVYIFLLYYVFIFSFGWLLSPLNFSAGGVSADIVLTEYDYRMTFLYGMGIVIFFSIGAMFHTYTSKYKWNQHNQGNRYKANVVGVVRSKIKNNFTVSMLPTVFMLALLVIVLMLVGVGPANVLSRDVYLPVEVRGAKILGVALTPLVIMLLGYSFLRVSHLIRYFILFLLLLFFVLYFALASRWFSFILVLFILGVLMYRPNSAKIKVLVVTSAAAAFLMLIVPLSLRALESHGLFPYIIALVDGNVTLDWGQLEKMTNNLLFSYSLTGHIAIYEDIEIKYLLTSINPMPGSLVGWYDAAEVLRINPYTPFNAPGELLSHGVIYAAIFYFILGFYFSSLDNKINQYLSKDKLLLSALFVGLAVLYTVSSLQYNLRSGVRLLYYIIVFQIFIFILHNFKKSIVIK